ncbi:hypothetical protein SK44_01665 [Klebsiella aerogenes]|nr:hypothetical protein SK44_01665 [Klebsiella aerogenes]VEI10901.1 Uncharacterised protein [Klebsiella aerogenes]
MLSDKQVNQMCTKSQFFPVANSVVRNAPLSRRIVWLVKRGLIFQQPRLQCFTRLRRQAVFLFQPAVDMTVMLFNAGQRGRQI